MRLPTFCSGCPHNRSTRVPEGSVATAGIGCHSMAVWLEDRATRSFTQMGGEGLHWVGQAPFTARPHMFQNLGDGTYYHSGLLAVRAAISSGVNITYKLLYNDAVAMTGGQPVEGCLLVADITRELHAEGVRAIAVVSEEPGRRRADSGFAPGVTFHHRDELDRVQRRLREVAGVSVLIYDQTCAAEKRRRRRRGDHPDPPVRAFINEAVCEGCGDCNERSNCVSIEPVETPFGRKRRVNQASCNKDFSCVDGFCPSFVTVHGAEPAPPRAARTPRLDAAIAALPAPRAASCAEPYAILVAGIGGTGVVTASALISMAAHLEGRHCTSLDLTGIAVKNGAVSGHIRICDEAAALHGARIAARGADLLIGCDMIVAANREMIGKYHPERTAAVVNERVAPTYAFQARPDLDLDNRRMKRALAAAIAPARTRYVDAERPVARLVGDAMSANVFLLGFALQAGLLPVGAAAIERAIELNGVAVAANKRALDLGRLAAHDAAAVDAPRDRRRRRMASRIRSRPSLPIGRRISPPTRTAPTPTATAGGSSAWPWPSAPSPRRATRWRGPWRAPMPACWPTRTSTRSPASMASRPIGGPSRTPSAPAPGRACIWRRRCSPVATRSPARCASAPSVPGSGPCCVCWRA